MFKWAREHDCPWDSFTCHAAARRGHLEVLQWARAHNCPWDVWTCAWTAAGGQLEVLQWARANGRAMQVDPIKPTLSAPGTQRFENKI